MVERERAQTPDSLKIAITKGWKFLNSREAGLEAAILKDSVTAHRSNRVSVPKMYRKQKSHTELWVYKVPYKR